ncbi:putative immunoglobulin-blocking virulence protein [Mycoplasmopsis opalescens]|uniref:putative immunoglobulin-blocking virulence protein n=1 Tax=Mycoplasmopsis opalescens TaxID=114886 RepID=UPI000A7BAF96|nr:putative immunoglobulin-blocking virulence protein [Mycoplasmopsis opalescens]
MMKKKRKLIIFTLATMASLSLSASVGTYSYFSIADSKSKITYRGGNSHSPRLKDGGEFDISNSISGNNDSDKLKEKKQPEVIAPKEPEIKEDINKDIEIQKDDKLKKEEDKKEPEKPKEEDKKEIVDRTKLTKTIADALNLINELNDPKYLNIKKALEGEYNSALIIEKNQDATAQQITDSEDKLSKAIAEAKKLKEAIDNPKPPIISDEPSKPEPAPDVEIKPDPIPEPEKPKEEEKKEPEKPKEEEKKEPDKPKEEEKKEPEKPIVNPQKPEDKKEDIVNKKIIIDGAEVNAKVKLPKDRHDYPDDVKRGLTNKKKYQNNAVGEVIEIEVTEELIKKQIEGAKQGSHTGVFDDFRWKTWTKEKELDPNTKEGLEKLSQLLVGTENEKYNYDNYIHRYLRLLNSPHIKKFLVERAQQEYDTKIPEFDREVKENERKYKELEEEAYRESVEYHKLPINQQTEERYEPIRQKFREAAELKRKHESLKAKKNIWLISNLDPNKFNKLGKNAQDMLKKGYTVDPSNSYINENGEIDSYAYSPAPGFNSTIDRQTRDNKQRRVFGYDSWHGLSGDAITKDVYPGWKTENVTHQYKGKYNLPDRGVTIKKLTKEDGSKTGIILEINAEVADAYNNTVRIINEFKAKGEKITGYKIINMGKLGRQSFKEILKALPDNIELLKLFYASHNTSDLIELENKHIKELGLYSTSNRLPYEDGWSVNPLALKNVEWINSIDYNYPGGYSGGYIPPSRLIVDTLAFDEGDYKADEKGNITNLERINDGLRIAYWTRNNEPFFQGGFGPGLEPDHKESGNSWPLGLDLSRTKKLRSLKGLQFYDRSGKNNTTRKLKRLKLYSEGEYFDIDIDDLNDAQFAEIMISSQPQMPKTKITFSDRNTKKIRITSRNNTKLNYSGLRNLQALFRWCEELTDKTLYASDDQTKNNLSYANGSYSISLAEDDISII